MTRKPDLNDISASRIAQADHVSKRRPRPPGRDLITEASAITHLPSYPMRSEEEELKAEELTAEEEQLARRAVARYAMLRAHGCTGKRCRRHAHQADRDWRDRFLMMLKLMPYEPGEGRHYLWGEAAAGDAQ